MSRAQVEQAIANKDEALLTAIRNATGNTPPTRPNTAAIGTIRRIA